MYLHPEKGSGARPRSNRSVRMSRGDVDLERSARRDPLAPRPRSDPSGPTVHTLSDARIAQFAGIRSDAVENRDYG